MSIIDADWNSYQTRYPMQNPINKNPKYSYQLVILIEVLTSVLLFKYASLRGLCRRIIGLSPKVTEPPAKALHTPLQGDVCRPVTFSYDLRTQICNLQSVTSTLWPMVDRWLFPFTEYIKFLMINRQRDPCQTYDFFSSQCTLTFHLWPITSFKL